MTSTDCGDTIDTLLVTEHGPACDWRLDLAPTHHLSSALHTSLWVWTRNADRLDTNVDVM